MPKKFGMDKRIVSLSAQVMSKSLTREEAIEILNESPFLLKFNDRDVEFVIKKLGLTHEEFFAIWNGDNHSFQDYPSYHPVFLKISRLIKPFVKFFLAQMPSYFIQLEVRNRKKYK